MEFAGRASRAVLVHPMAGLGATVGREQEDLAATGTRGHDHAFAQAERRRSPARLQVRGTTTTSRPTNVPVRKHS